MPEISALWSPAPADATAWLAHLSGDDGLTGYLVPGLPDAAWVLNAMYEREEGPGTVSHHAARRAALADGSAEPLVAGGLDLDGEGLLTTGGGLGWARHPGPGWRRLRWAELARRGGEPVVREGMLPSYRSAPDATAEDGSWLVGVEPPTEGSLDRESWDRLTALLAEHSPAGPDTPCLAYYNPMVMRAVEYDSRHVLAGRLGDARALAGLDDPDFSPSNLWAADGSWVVCTDYDLWATKVAGPTSLVGAVLADTELEAVRLPWAG
ncbi:hypothetical protein [Streptomyces albireticuli]|uniref:Uncharacterized protein n=1 Tax=Streptomyces albireticuli TaxID=1940 RepID=A0A2A2D595_9ACTN|nr:hypothetical protein [Streptomyces albireticuli]MCD9145682.1 hypothetical protein [Streptomyces albireticuli]MCD9165586.1 hypothetical protein [Streptomyces albireticuli]MCD9195891.1 hypothetical protein [Streptomyces albireticuli]PAU46616.1 hypothetical protein CK936_23145 [Streptomyces albireticuli]